MPSKNALMCFILVSPLSYIVLNCGAAPHPELRADFLSTAHTSQRGGFVVSGHGDPIYAPSNLSKRFLSAALSLATFAASCATASAGSFLALA